MPGLDAAWSRDVAVVDARRSSAHLARARQRGGAGRRGTLLCVHGNPTWSYLWRRFLAPRRRRVGAWWRSTSSAWATPSAARSPATLAERIDDLDAITAALGITGPVVAGGARLGRTDLARLGAAPP